MAIHEISLFLPVLQFSTVGDSERFHGFFLSERVNDLSAAVHGPAVQHPIHRWSTSSTWHLPSNNKWMELPPVGQRMCKYTFLESDIGDSAGTIERM
jgi:hypothetical protein